MSRVARSAAVIGAVTAVGLGGMAAPAQAAPGAAKAPRMSVSLSPTVKGNVLTYSYSESGRQHLVKSSKTKRVYDNKESAGYVVLVDGKKVAGADGLGTATCTTTGLAAFSSTAPKATYRFAKAGRHTVRVVGFFCGAKGLTAVTKTYTVVSKAAKPAPKPAPKGKASLKAVGTFTAGKPLRLVGQCTSTSVRTATVAGPRNLKGVLKRTATKGALTGNVTVPSTLKGGWVRLRITCADGATATTIVKRTGAKTTPPPAR